MHPRLASNRHSHPRQRDIGRWGPMMPLKLKAVLIAHRIALGDMAERIINRDGRPLSRDSIYQAINRGKLPLTSTPDFKAQVAAWLADHGVAEDQIGMIWERETGVTQLRPQPEDQSYRIMIGMQKQKGNQISDLIEEATMLTPTAMKKFKLFQSPFLNDVREEKDVYLSESHSYALAAMEDAARNGGFVAVCGECGGGKSVLRRMLVERLLDGGEVRVIQPQILDKKQMMAGHLLDAIIDDISPGAPIRSSREAKARQVRKALVDSANSGQKHVLIIEEAHDLTVPTMKLLKRLWEIERGMSKVLGIIMIGQAELKQMLNMHAHFEMREVILRCLLATLAPLDADLEDYVAFKLARIGKATPEILAEGWGNAVRTRLTNRDGYSALYPLHIHNLLARAMNLAAEYGESKVSPEIILEA